MTFNCSQLSFAQKSAERSSDLRLKKAQNVCYTIFTIFQENKKYLEKPPKLCK